MQAIRRGDAEAFESLFRAYFDRLVIFARSYVGSVEAAEDVVEEVFFNIWRIRERWDLTGSVSSYLYSATRNQALNVRKRRGLERAHLETLVDDPPAPVSVRADAGLLTRDLRAAAELAIGRLPERCREVFLLHRQHGLSYREIAEATGVTRKTVENQMGRALKLLRDSLRDFF